MSIAVFLSPRCFSFFSAQLSVLARDKEELSQLSSTQPSALLISSVTAVEITASGGGEACKSARDKGEETAMEETEREKEEADLRTAPCSQESA